VSWASDVVGRLVSGPIASVLDQVLHSPWLARAPIGIYRAGLGFLFGSRMLMLEHIGRKSGQRRYVVLEVIAHETPDSYVIASGFGESAQWFRNVMAEPQVRISTGRRRSVRAQARRMTADEADAALSSYIARHPRAWEALRRVIADAVGGRVDPPGTEVPMVELTVR
jgi:deazaflavin-dependent oxidoreductase (nitroreductase family)